MPCSHTPATANETTSRTPTATGASRTTAVIPPSSSTDSGLVAVFDPSPSTIPQLPCIPSWRA